MCFFSLYNRTLIPLLQDISRYVCRFWSCNIRYWLLLCSKWQKLSFYKFYEKSQDVFKYSFPVKKIKSVVKKICFPWLIDALKTSIFVVNGQLRENPEVIADKFNNFFSNVRVSLVSKILASNTSFQSFYKGSQRSINISFTCEH